MQESAIVLSGNLFRADNIYLITDTVCQLRAKYVGLQRYSTPDNNNKASHDAASRTAAILVLMSDNRGCGPGPSGNGCCAAGGIMRYLNTIRKVTPAR